MKKVVIGLILGIMAVGAAIGVVTCMACGTPDDDELIPSDDDDEEHEASRQRGASFVCPFESMKEQNIEDDESLVENIIKDYR